MEIKKEKGKEKEKERLARMHIHYWSTIGESIEIRV
jgi:hypothetical protein